MSYTEYDIRMKSYERVTDIKLVPRSPVIIRVDGRAFSTLTKKFDKPFDNVFGSSMEYTTMQLCKNIQNCVIAYTQSDEIVYRKMIEARERGRMAQLKQRAYIAGVSTVGDGLEAISFGIISSGEFTRNQYERRK